MAGIWLSIDNKGNLFIYSAPIEDNPLMDLPTGQAGISEKKGVPLLTMDVREYASNLKMDEKQIIKEMF